MLCTLIGPTSLMLGLLMSNLFLSIDVVFICILCINAIPIDVVSLDLRSLMPYLLILCTRVHVLYNMCIFRLY